MNSIGCDIKTWKKFGEIVRAKGCTLLSRLDDFPNSVLVTGCQRSGTTILSRMITQSEEMVNYWFGRDDELDAALILSGYINHKPKGRYCFQTTYLNECYQEYFDQKDTFKIIWVIRNPNSVVYSLIYNWRRWALNELFRACGTEYLSDSLNQRYKRFGVLGVPVIIRACASYKGKTAQLFELLKGFDKSNLKIVDYDDLVENKESKLKEIFHFLRISYDDDIAKMMHSKSINKKNKLSNNESRLIESICMPIYMRAKGKM